MKNSAYVLLIFLFGLILPVSGQNFVVSGKVSDTHGKPIPFSTVFVKEISKGLSTGEDGEFSLTLPPGDYSIKFQSIGYKLENKQVKLLDKNINLKIVLHVLSYDLKEVVISGKDNPANRIMRSAIARGAYYKKLLKSYNAEVYVKSGQKLEKLSDLVKFMAGKDNEMPKVGELYFAESYNKVDYRSPDQYTQTVLRAQSSKNPMGGSEVPGIGFLTTDFFQPMVMDAPSPLGRNAFSNYDFKLDGISNSDSQAVYKIKVVPKRPGIFFKGYIYIENRNYLLKTLDLDMEAAFMIYNVRMDYEEMKGAVILPGSFYMKFKFSMFGNDFTGNTSGSIDYKKIVLDSTFRFPAASVLYGIDQSDSAAKAIKSARELKLQQDLDKLLSKPEMNMNDMNKFMRIMKKQEKEQKKDSTVSLEIKERVKVKKDSLYSQHDTTWWKAKRPVPLSNEEAKSKDKIDSAFSSKTKQNGKMKSDTSKKDRPFAWYKYPQKLFLGGVLWEDSLWTFRTNGMLLSASYFSPVDGFTLADHFVFSGKFKHSGNAAGISITPMYAFDRKDLMTDAKIWMNYLKRRPSAVSLRYFSMSADFNNTNPEDRTVNSLTALFLHQNHLKQIHDEGFSFRNVSEIVNGFVFGAGFDVHKYMQLQNNSTYSFKYGDSLYPVNIPDNPLFKQIQGESLTHTVLYGSLQYTFRNKYRMKEGRKINAGSEYPVVKLEYFQGIPAFSSRYTEFTQFVFTVNQAIDMGIFTEFRYSVKAGFSENISGQQFSEFYHPAVNEIPFSFHPATNSYYLIPNYTYSTPEAFIDAHAQYESTCILLKRLPFLSKKLMTEKIGISYFQSSVLHNYNELFYGFGKIYFGGEALLVVGFRNAVYTNTGLMLKFSFN